MYSLPANPITPFNIVLNSQPVTADMFAFLSSIGFAGIEVGLDGIVSDISHEAKAVLGTETAAWAHIASLLHSEQDELGHAIAEVLTGKSDRVLVDCTFLRVGFPIRARALVFARRDEKRPLDRFYVALDKDSLAGMNGVLLAPPKAITPKPAAVKPQTAAKRVLLVEDSGFFRRALTQSLEDHGFIVRAVENGESALQCSLLEKPDVILLDMFLPKLNGMTLLRVLRANSVTRSVPVVLLSGSADSLDVDRARALGISSYFSKASTSVEQIATELERVTADIATKKWVS